MESPLEGVRVLDMTEALAGPYCGMMLGDLGADVIKIERPGMGDQARMWGPPFLNGESAYFLSVNRNKRSFACDIKKPHELQWLHALIKRSDVFLTNIPRMDSLKRAQLDPQTLQQINPRLVHVAISGYGHSGPKAGRSGYDLVAQGEAGLMALTGDPNSGPMRFPTPMADITAGLYAVIGILSALRARDVMGKGQFIDVSLVEAQTTWLANVGGTYFATGQRPKKIGNLHPTITPYQPMRAQDKMMIIAVGTEGLWQRFCKLLGVEQTLMCDERFKTNPLRNLHRATLIPLLEEVLMQRCADEWLEQFVANDIPAGPINFPDEILNDRHMKAREMIVELEHPLAGLIKSIGNPIHMSVTPPTYRRYPPLLGEHNAEILAELGIMMENGSRR